MTDRLSSWGTALGYVGLVSKQLMAVAYRSGASQFSDQSLLHIKAIVHGLLGNAWQVVARAMRLVPGLPLLLGVPWQRIRSIPSWVNEQRSACDWWERREAAYYETVRPAFFERGLKMPLCAVSAQAHLSTGVGRYHVHNEVFLAGLPGGRVLGPNGVVITPDGRGVIEESTWGTGWLEKDRALTSWRLPTPEFCAGHYFTMASHSANGYAHWVFDALPRLALLEGLPTEELRVIILGALNSWQQESLEMLGLAHLSFLPLENRYLQLEVLHLPSYVGKPGNAHPDACRWLRERLLKNISNEAPQRRLYVTRRRAGRRHVVNEAELEPVLADYGFEIVEAESLSFRAQVELFSRAAVVVGPHGAGLSNLVFAPPGCKVLELFAPSCLRWMYYYLAAVMQQPYWYLVAAEAIPASRVHQDEGFDNLRITVDDFERSLRALLGE